MDVLVLALVLGPILMQSRKPKVSVVVWKGVFELRRLTVGGKQLTQRVYCTHFGRVMGVRLCDELSGQIRGLELERDLTREWL